MKFIVMLMANYGNFGKRFGDYRKLKIFALESKKFSVQTPAKRRQDFTALDL